MLVIDMVKGMEKWIPWQRMKKILPNVKLALERARDRKIPVIYAVHRPLGKKGTKIYDGIKPRKGEPVLNKNRYSCFFETNLDRILRKMKIKRLVLAGVSTHWCVLATALDGYYRNYKIVLLRDSMAAPSDRKQRAALEWMGDTFPFAVRTSRQRFW